MKDLKDIRVEIDSIDSQLAPLLKRRLEIADEVAAFKRSVGKPVNDPVRERAILTKVSEMVSADFARGVRTVYSTLFGISKARQRVLVGDKSPIVEALAAAEKETAAKFPELSLVACCGEEGSFAQQAASRIFDVPTLLSFTDNRAVFKAVEKGVCPYGVVPIENSVTGTFADVYDMMQEHGFYFVRSVRVKVDPSGNYTRFACFSRRLETYPRANAVALAFSLPHRPGTLGEIIAKFSAIGANLTKLASRPVLGSTFEYRFVVEFEATMASPDVRALLAELSLDPEIERFAFLGVFEEL